MAQRETAALWECFKSVATPLVDQRATPERYKMAMEGACLDEERAALRAAETHLSAMDEGQRQITSGTMVKLRSYYRETRAQLISRYVVLYETHIAKAVP